MNDPNSTTTARLHDFSLQAMGTGMLAAVVGFTGSFALVLQGLRSAGASEEQAISGLLALTVGMGLSGILVAWKYRMPIGVAWSTPGAALLISSGHTLGSINEAVGAYLFSAVLLIIAGLFRPLGRLMESIPAVLANAMLAGVLIGICLSPIQALAYDSWLAAPLLLTWWLVGRRNRYFAVPAALLVLLVLVSWRLGLPEGFADELQRKLLPELHWINPSLDVSAMVSIGIPLFVVTMASQNVPGIAVLRASGYQPRASGLLINTGVFSLFCAPLGAHAINLAAITAAMFTSTDAHEDPQRRYWASIVAGISYVILGLLAGVIGLWITLVPSILVEAIAGLALLGSFSAAVVAALTDPRFREAAAITFLFAASGVTFFGVGGAFWGLIAGGIMYLAKQQEPAA